LKYSLHLHQEASLEYEAAWKWQRDTTERLRSGGPEAVAVLQHPPVYTLGRRARYEHLLIDAEELRDRGAALVESDRGGNITFHGPGQLVCYPILDLRRRGLGPTDYVRALEETMVRTLAGFGIEGVRSAGQPGVWTRSGKIGAVGVRVQGGITTHGFALNVETDLAWFEAIVPCGIAGASVASIESVLGYSPGIAAVEAVLLEEFSAVFESELQVEAQATKRYVTSLPANLENRELVLTHGD
jgi:lipoyl(octanoyl) transferase